MHEAARFRTCVERASGRNPIGWPLCYYQQQLVLDYAMVPSVDHRHFVRS
jgi:hypothetical protein